MSNIQITSTTDSPEDVVAATGDVQTSQDDVVEEPKNETEEKPEVKAKDDPDEDEGLDDEAQPKKSKGGFKRRIDRLRNQVSEAEREKEFWRQEALKGKEQKPETISDAEKPKLEGKPKSDDFESHDAYLEAMIDWKAEQKLEVRDQKERERQVKTSQQARMETHISKVESFAKEHDDFHEAMEEVDDIPMSQAVQEVILTSEDGPRLMYELAKNRDEYERISKLPALAAARALGAFEASLSAPKQLETKPTKAPPPIKPVGTKSTNASSKKPDEMDFQEFKRWRAEHPNG